MKYLVLILASLILVACSSKNESGKSDSAATETETENKRQIKEITITGPNYNSFEQKLFARNGNLISHQKDSMLYTYDSVSNKLIDSAKYYENINYCEYIDEAASKYINGKPKMLVHKNTNGEIWLKEFFEDGNKIESQNFEDGKLYSKTLNEYENGKIISS
ncbi:MAG: hypothetical protein HUK15_08145, partial [Bacteroidales bacterium]|nr:hypothetical protein [Bacteroidales bacterium]